MSWFDSEGKLPHHVIFSQTSYKRNPANQPFLGKCDPKTRTSSAERIDALLLKNGFRKDPIADGDTVQLRALAEKGFVDVDFLRPSPLRALYFNEPCSLAVSVGGKDLITIRSLLSGLAVTETRNIASGAEELLDSEFEFAYSDASGYLSPTPSRCGSGAEFSALLYLPSLRINSSEEPLRHRLSCSRAILAPFLTQSMGSDLYLLTHRPSHLCDEIVSSQAFDSLISSIVEEETAAERIIFAESSKIIIDKAWRAYGALLYTRSLSAADMLSLSSSIRIALALCDGKSTRLPPVSVTLLNSILGRGLDCSVISESGACRSGEECNDRRAELISGLLYSSVGERA